MVGMNSYRSQKTAALYVMLLNHNRQVAFFLKWCQFANIGHSCLVFFALITLFLRVKTSLFSKLN